METANKPKTMRFKEVCAMMGASPNWCRKWIKDNCPEIPYKGKRKVEYTPKEIELIKKEFGI